MSNHPAARGSSWSLLVAVALLLSGCATGTPVGFRIEASHFRYRSAVPQGLTRLGKKHSPPVSTVDSARVVPPRRNVFTSGARALQAYKEFIQERREALSGLSAEERRLEEAVLREMEWWLWQQDEAKLTQRHPIEVHSELFVARRSAERREAARRAAVEAKLEEYLRWAETMAARMMRQHFERVGREYLASDSAALQMARHELVSAVLAWAFRHTEDPDFLRKSPSQVALYLLAGRSALSTALMVGRGVPSTLDYARMSDKTPEEEGEDETRELVVGLIPGVGDVVDLGAFLTGYSVTGRRMLDERERLLCALGVVIPVLPGRAVGTSAEALQRVALLTGRSLDEVYTMTRIVRHLAPADARELERLTRKLARNGELTDAERAFIHRTARDVEGPLNELREAFKRGEKVPLFAVRTDSEGLRLMPGSPEHMAQAWVDYQFRHPERYPSFRYAPDEKWQRMYRTVLENKGKGGDFEQVVLKALGHEKNTALMLPPPGSKAQGFVPDAVPGNPNPGELVWGRPYRFVETKARGKLALTGNLEAMLNYVQAYGGHVELWVRSTRHSDGPTQLTGPLQDLLNRLKGQGRAGVKYHP